ncbi:aldose epimerase [Paenibacillus aurantius]|uniref:Aldose epimerase n=1 Tax=Paenibacillus aurantius TaxID=2918900 RepID=A0AA96LD24_9BACL|nr:aldose epimerase [Paenibacillus aurantius]WNQ10954.1 aldose epimerase [Paenibacillus aurantius]
MGRYQVVQTVDCYPVWELVEEATRSVVRICPERGGIVTGFRSKGRELLYLDRQTYEDPEANIRGGIPVLFPICGQLPDGRYEWDGESFTMPNHGVARNRPWEVAGTETEGHAAITLKLTSDAGTLESYPFDFELRFTYLLKDGGLTIRQEYGNRSEASLPVYAGFHPYFASDRKELAYASDASSVLDLNDGREKPFHGSVDLTGRKEAVFLLGTKQREIAFQPAEGYGIRMSYGGEFRYIVLWSVPDKPFVCVEPWMAKTNEMNLKEELVMIPAGETLVTELAISCGPA